MKLNILKVFGFIFLISGAVHAQQNIASNSSGCTGTLVITGNSSQSVTIGSGQTVMTINGVTTITNNSSGSSANQSASQLAGLLAGQLTGQSTSQPADNVAISASREDYIARVQQQISNLQAAYAAKLANYNAQLQAYNSANASSQIDAAALLKKYRDLKIIKNRISAAQAKIAQFN